MKRLSLYLFILLFTFQTPSWADDIRDFQIEGISIGDSLLDFFSENEIKENMLTDYPSSKKFSRLNHTSPKYETYDGMQFHFKTKDNNYIIYEFSGQIFYTDSIESCYDKKDKVVEELTELFKEAEIDDVGTVKHPDDKTGESTQNIVYFNFKSGDSVQIACFDWSKKKGYQDHLRISIASFKVINWFRNEAFK